MEQVGTNMLAQRIHAHLVSCRRRGMWFAWQYEHNVKSALEATVAGGQHGHKHVRVEISQTEWSEAIEMLAGAFLIDMIPSGNKLGDMLLSARDQSISGGLAAEPEWAKVVNCRTEDEYWSQRAA